MPSLSLYLQAHTAEGAIDHKIAAIVESLAKAGVTISKLCNQNGLPGIALGVVSKSSNSDGDIQKKLDLLADECIVNCLKQAPVAAYFSEELDSAQILNNKEKYCVCADPLDGSSNIDNNMPIGTIFSILPKADNLKQSALQSGSKQLASGIILYGPQTILLLTIRSGVVGFCLREDGVFLRLNNDYTLPNTTKYFAINASNRYYWMSHTAQYIDTIIQKSYNMRWVATLAADAYRILRQGGIFLYPEDQRMGYGRGRLRLVYEANPIALLIEQAGGSASDGVQDILTKVPTTIHERTPFVFGVTTEVESALSFYQ